MAPTCPAIARTIVVTGLIQNHSGEKARVGLFVEREKGAVLETTTVTGAGVYTLVEPDTSLRPTLSSPLYVVSMDNGARPFCIKVDKDRFREVRGGKVLVGEAPTIDLKACDPEQANIFGATVKGCLVGMHRALLLRARSGTLPLIEADKLLQQHAEPLLTALGPLQAKERNEFFEDIIQSTSGATALDSLKNGRLTATSVAHLHTEDFCKKLQGAGNAPYSGFGDHCEGATAKASSGGIAVASYAASKIEFTRGDEPVEISWHAPANTQQCLSILPTNFDSTWRMDVRAAIGQRRFLWAPPMHPETPRAPLGVVVRACDRGAGAEFYPASVSYPARRESAPSAGRPDERPLKAVLLSPESFKRAYVVLEERPVGGPVAYLPRREIPVVRIGERTLVEYEFPVSQRATRGARIARFLLTGDRADDSLTMTAWQH
jgi:hypothetical protein